MKICYTVDSVSAMAGYYSVRTNAAEVRIWFLTDDIVRVRANFDGDFDEASYSLVMTAWDSRTDALFGRERKCVQPAQSSLAELGDKWVIRGAKLTLEIEKSPFRLTILDQDGTILHQDIPDLALRKDSNGRRMHTSYLDDADCFYGFGEKTGPINKAGQRMNMAPGDAMGYDPANTDSLYKHIPFYIKLSPKTKKACGYFYHSTAECDFNMGKERRNYWHHYSTFTVDGGDIDLFFIAGPKITDVIERYTDLTGKSAMLPIGALGYLGSSMYYPELPKDADDAILEFIDTAKEEGIPTDGMQLSSGYCAVETEQGIKRCTFTWNNKRWKDPADWFAQMKQRGILVSPNVKPGMLLVHPLLEEMKQKRMFIRASKDGAAAGTAGSVDGYAVGTWWGGKGLFVDFTNAETRGAWKELLTEHLLAYGCESIWNDNCEYDSVVDKDAVVSYEGKGGTIGELKPVMSNLMCKLSNEAIREYKPNVRPFSVCRSGHAGIQRYAQVWAGDNYTSWETLRSNIATNLGMGLSGVANTGCDVGGFYGPAPSEELFVRWVQNGIFMPRFSIHSTNTDNTVTEPWMYSGTKDLIRDAIRLRYQLSPYLYSLMRRAHVKGLPIMEPTFLVFQNDENTYKEGVDFLFGDYLLVANVVEEGATTREIYLPRIETGEDTERHPRFYDFVAREAFEPGTTLERETDLADLPMYIRSGAIIPMAENDLMNLAKDKVTRLRILLAPDVDSTFDLYEDDGVSNDYLEGCSLTTHIAVQAGEQTRISFRREGTYETSVQTMHLDVVHREKAPFGVRIEDRELHHFLHRRKFEEAEEGWYYSQSKKSVEIKYANPQRDYTVQISFEQLDLIGM